MDPRYCHSCTAPLHLPGFAGPNDNYCRHCTDADGELLPREAVRHEIAHWLRSWQPGIDEPESLRRAELFMSAMPAWNQTSTSKD